MEPRRPRGRPARQPRRPPRDERWPALILGTSSDRIGTPEGRAYYATLSKDLTDVLGLPVAPYVGVSYGTFEDEARLIGGVSVRLGSRWNALVIHDGVDVHPTVSVIVAPGLQLGALLVDGRDPGLTASWSF